MPTPRLLSLDEFPVGCLVTDEQRRIVYSNQYIADQYGYSAGALLGQDLFCLFNKASQILFESFIVPMLTQQGQCAEIRLSIQSAQERLYPVVVSVVSDPQKRRHFWSIANAKRAEKLFVELQDTQQLLEQKVTMLRSLSDLDPLTGLPNRTALSRYLDNKMVEPCGESSAFALIFLDLDGFKEINDGYGHQVGDKVLQLVASRLSSHLRQGDMVARFGGDEFVIVFTGSFHGNVEETLQSRLVSRLIAPFEVAATSHNLSASIGVTLYPQAGALEPDQLIRQADQAMYQAKLAGKNQICVFNVDDEDVQKERHQELLEIQTALDEEQFELYYQPKVNMRTGAVIGAEALIRWNHPEEGLKTPGEFLPVLTNTFKSILLGRWVISTALKQLQAWRALGLEMSVSVNIDGYHLQHAQFVRDIALILNDFPDLPKHCLEIEVLETSTIDDVNYVASVLQACRGMGIRVSLDDFGTGYSSLSHLRDISVDTLKIDQTFVQNMLTSRGDMAIVKGVIGFARAFECAVIAEGVETLAHQQALLSIGCEWGQGYYMARPMPAAALTVWARAWRSSHAAGLDDDGHGR